LPGWLPNYNLLEISRHIEGGKPAGARVSSHV
jgi:hypothetical protein